jgi:hypothetical protein
MERKKAAETFCRSAATHAASAPQRAMGPTQKSKPASSGSRCRKSR